MNGYLKELHLSSNYEELVELTKIKDSITKHKITNLANTAEKLANKADDMLKVGDEEQAYLFNMKYFNVLTIIGKYKKKINDPVSKQIQMPNGTIIKNRLDITEKLKDSLIKRYAERDAKKKQEVNKGIIKVEPRKNASFITNIKLFELMTLNKNQQRGLLLIDCRPEEDFNATSIKYPFMINIPKGIIAGTTPSKLTSKIKEKFRHLWEKRGEMETVVLIDENTNEDGKMDVYKPIWILRDILFKWDPDNEYKSLYVLDGGFENFQVAFPTETSDPWYTSAAKNLHESYEVKDIEYPNLDEMKTRSAETAKPQIPRFDRSIKPIHKPLMSYGSSERISILKEVEKKMDQVIQKEDEMSLIGQQIMNVPVNETEQAIQLEYQLIQKDNELDDTMNELNTTIQPEFESQLTNLRNSAPQNSEEQAVTAGIIAKRQKVIEMEHIRKIEREKQKRHLDLMKEPIRPKVPAIDRSAKPAHDLASLEQLNIQVPFPQKQRSFSPVHGSYGEIGATGLKNLGNTCYMNSVIQCLLNCEGLCDYLRKDRYRKHINRKSKTGGHLTEELAQLCKELWSGKYKSVTPRDFRNAIGAEHRMFATYDQQDAHELLVLLIDMLHSELQFPVYDMITSDQKNKSEVAWREFVKNMESCIQRLFFGQFRSTIKCRCGFESATYEGFSHLSLELPERSDECELNYCLDLFFDGEIINGWTCPGCKQSREAVKKVDMSKLPPVLVIHLKRFKASLDSPNKFDKKQNYIHFPINCFEVNNYVIPSQRQHLRSYELFAVSNHYGTMNRGHYTAFCQNSRSKRWYKYDDNYVTQINDDEVRSSAAYILFYSNI